MGQKAKGRKLMIFNDDCDYNICKTTDILSQKTRPTFLKNKDSIYRTAGHLIALDWNSNWWLSYL